MPGRGTDANGYGHQHRKLKARWQKRIDRGEYIECHADLCLIEQDGGTRQVTGRSHEWDLGHTPDRSDWTGPEHPRCNRTEGINRRWATTPSEPVPSRRWVL